MKSQVNSSKNKDRDRDFIFQIITVWNKGERDFHVDTSDKLRFHFH